MTPDCETMRALRGGWARRLFIFAKRARIGRAKTRLARSTGASTAIRFYRESLTGLATRLGADPRWRTIVAADPPDAAYTDWFGLSAIAQAHGDLGARMGAVFRHAPPGPAVVIGTDAPFVGRGDIARAFAALRSADAVFGPAEDGGFWLMGLRRMRGAPGLFDGVRWSSAHALADTRATLPPGFRTAQLARLRDVDEAADLAAAGPLLRSRARP